LGTTGSEIAETAVVLPILFSILLGIFFFGRAYNIYGTITQAAMQGARAAVAPACATCGSGTLTAAQIATNVVAPVLQASHLDTGAVQSLQPAACPCASVTTDVICPARSPASESGHVIDATWATSLA